VCLFACPNGDKMLGDLEGDKFEKDMENTQKRSLKTVHNRL
jgi:hypothetical protein